MFFSRSIAARVRPPVISGSRTSPVASGRSALSAANPTRAAAKIARQTKIRFSALVPRMMKTAAVAHTSAPSVKNCHGRMESCAGWVEAKGLIEAFELAVEPFLQRGVIGRNRGLLRHRRRVVRSPRPFSDHECPADGRESTDGVWKEPCKPVEAFVDGRRERFLAAIFHDVVLQNLVARLPLPDKPAQLRAHLGGLAAGALGEILPSTRAAHADDVALQLAFMRRIQLHLDRSTVLCVLRECRRCETEDQQNRP